jgi:hypothetical protein
VENQLAAAVCEEKLQIGGINLLLQYVKKKIQIGGFTLLM